MVFPPASILLDTLPRWCMRTDGTRQGGRDRIEARHNGALYPNGSQGVDSIIGRKLRSQQHYLSANSANARY